MTGEGLHYILSEKLIVIEECVMILGAITYNEWAVGFFSNNEYHQSGLLCTKFGIFYDLGKI